MSKYEKLIRKGDDPILKAVCDPVAPGESVTDLLETMYRAAKRSGLGVGLAAPQVGVAKCVIIVMTQVKGVRWLSMINPEIINISPDTVVGKEGCLSYPGIEKYIRRPAWVNVEYQDEKHRPQRKHLEGWDARVFCHEFDHLRGVCLVGDPNFHGELEYDHQLAKNQAKLAASVLACAALGVG